MVGAGRASSGTYPTRWLFDASQTVLIMHAEGRHHPWLPLFATELVSWLPWA